MFSVLCNEDIHSDDVQMVKRNDQIIMFIYFSPLIFWVVRGDGDRGPTTARCVDWPSAVDCVLCVVVRGDGDRGPTTARCARDNRLPARGRHQGVGADWRQAGGYPATLLPCYPATLLPAPNCLSQLKTYYCLVVNHIYLSIKFYIGSRQNK